MRVSRLTTVGVVLLVLCALPLQRAHGDKVKANNSKALNDPDSWIGGVPGATDVAIFDNTLTLTTAANGTTPAPLGADLSILGIKVGTPAGGPALGQVNNQNGILISNGGANTLTLGASGIDMSDASAVPLDIQSRILIGANQTWNIGLASNNITNPTGATTAGSSSSPFNFQQDEDLVFAAQAADNLFNLNGKTVTKTGAGTVLIHGGYLVSNGTVNVNEGFLAVQGGSNRLTTIANTVTLNVNSGGVLRFQSNSGAMLSNATINLNDGGILHLTTNNATLTATVAGPLHVSGSAIVRAAPNPISGNNNATPLIISGNITGDAASNLSLRNQNSNASTSFQLSGDNSGFLGTFTLDGDAGQRAVRLMNNNAGSAAATWAVTGGNTLQVSGNISVQLGTLNGDGAVANPTAATTATINVGAGNFNGTLAAGTGNLALNKVGPGILTLGGSNTHTGGTTVSAGTLRLASSAAIGSATAAVTLNTGGTLDLNGNTPLIGSISGAGGTITNSVPASAAILNVNNTAPVTFGGVIQDGAGTVGLVKTGAAPLTLSGANSYTGSTDVNEGALVVNGSLAAGGIVNVNGNTSFAGNGSAGNLILQPAGTIRPGPTAADGPVGALNLANIIVNGGDLRFDLVNPAGSDKITVAGSANFAGSSTITPTSTPVSGSYVLLTAADLSGTAPTLVTPPAGTTRATLTLDFNTTTDKITLNVTGSSKSLTWTGVNGPAWDINITQNWSDNGTLVPNEKFLNLDNVTFGNGPANRDVTLNATVNPGSVTVNSNSDYSITGGGSIADSGFLGGTSLTKSGTGKLTLGTVNTYLGPTNIQDGTVQLAAAGALPIGTALTLGAGTTSGVLDLGGSDATVSSLATSGTGTANTIGNSSTTTPVMLTVTGGSGTFAGKIQNTLGAGTQTVGLSLTGGTLTLSGANTYSGGTIVSNAATLRAGNPTALGAATGALLLNNTATLDLGGNGIAVGAVSGDAGTTITSTAAGTAILTTTAASDTTLGSNITNGAGTVGLVKNGAGTLTLTGVASAYSGGITINGGTIRTTTATTPGTGLATVNPGATLVMGAAHTLPITIAGGTIGSSSTIGTNAFTTNTLTAAPGTTSTVIFADPQDLASPNREMILNGALKGSGNILVKAGDSTSQTVDAGPGFRLRGTAASDFSGTITLAQRGKFELQNAVTGNFSPAGTGKIVMTAGTGTGALAGTYSVINLRNNSTGNVNYGNDVEVTGTGFVSFNMLGSAPVNAVMALGNLKVGDGQTVIVSRNTGTIYTLNFPTVTVTGGVTTFSPGSATFGYSGTADLSVGAIGQTAAGSGIVMNGATNMTVTGVASYTGPTTIDSGTLHVTGSLASSSGVTVNTGATLDASANQTVQALTINSGGTTLVKAGVLKVGNNTTPAPLTLDAATGAKLDLTSRGIALDTPTGAAETAALLHVRTQVIAGLNAGTWTGNGITSSAAATTADSKGIGYARAAEVLSAGGGTFLGAPVDGSGVLARYTLLGDATLDGLVDFNDLVKLAQNYNTTVSATTESWWNNGDFTYDGMVDFNDLVKLAQNYNTALPSEPVPGAPANFSADLTAAFASVPEPGACMTIAACGFALLARRRSIGRNP